MPRPLVVCVEGNIGCGKSTALRELESLVDPGAVAVFQEPVEAWGDMLAKFYDDPVRWAFPFSLRVLLSFCAPLKATDKRCVVVERSPVSCRHVFSQMHFNDGKMSQEEWELFKEYHDVLGWTPDLMVYVHAPPEECHERMRLRGRDAEAAVDLHYVKRIDFQYETMLRYADVPMMRVDGTADPARVARAIADIVASAMHKN